VGTIQNSSGDPLRCSVKWPYRNPASVDKMIVGETVLPVANDNVQPVHADFVLHPGESRFSIVQHNDFGVSNANKQFKWKAKALIRRRLSEFRDNHLSKNPALLSFAKSVHKRLLKKGAGSTEPS
jgi:hypothetical protein